MTRDRDILLIVLLLSGVAGGLFYLAAWFSMQTEVRQALMLVVGMLLMAAMSAFSTYLVSTPILRATAIPSNPAISINKSQSSAFKENKILTIKDSSDLDVIINEMFDQMLLLARQAGMNGRTDRSSFVAVATSLRYHGIIDDKIFQGVIFFRNTYISFDNMMHTEAGLLDVTIEIGKELVHQLRDLNTANEPTQAHTRRSS